MVAETPLVWESSERAASESFPPARRAAARETGSTVSSVSMTTGRRSSPEAAASSAAPDVAEQIEMAIAINRAHCGLIFTTILLNSLYRSGTACRALMPVPMSPMSRRRDRVLEKHGRFVLTFPGRRMIPRRTPVAERRDSTSQGGRCGMRNRSRRNRTIAGGACHNLR